MKLLNIATLASLVFSTGQAKAFFPKSFKSEVTKKTESVVTGKVLKSQGKIFYENPGKLRFEITKPERLVLVTNAERTWYYTAPAIEGEPGELKIGDAQNNGMAKFFDALKNGLKTNEEYTVKKVNKRAVIHFAEELQSALDLKKARLNFEGDSFTFKHLKSMQLTYRDGKKVDFVLSSIEIKDDIEDETFIFEKPENTRVQKL